MLEERVREALRVRASAVDTESLTWPDLERRLMDGGPSPEAGPRSPRRRLAAAAVALAVFVPAALFAWAALRPDDPPPPATETPPSPVLLHLVVRDGAPVGELAVDGQVHPGVLTSSCWSTEPGGEPLECTGGDAVPGEPITLVSGGAFSIESDADASWVRLRPMGEDAPLMAIDPVEDPAGRRLFLAPGPYRLQVLGRWGDDVAAFAFWLQVVAPSHWQDETCGGRPATIVGSTGDDLFLDGVGDDVIVFGGGNDSMVDSVVMSGGDNVACTSEGVVSRLFVDGEDRQGTELADALGLIPLSQAGRCGGSVIEAEEGRAYCAAAAVVTREEGRRLWFALRGEEYTLADELRGDLLRSFEQSEKSDPRHGALAKVLVELTTLETELRQAHELGDTSDAVFLDLLLPRLRGAMVGMTPEAAAEMEIIIEAIESGACCG